MTLSLLQIAIGGGIGACLRYGAGQLLAFPLGTLAVNLIGSFAIGLLFVQLDARGLAHWGPGLVTGLLGGFTTFSAFSLDTLRLLEDGRLAAAGGYVAASVGLGLLACGAGLWIGRALP
ncbi:fluoride efflux transporter FluC [Pseudoroseicyclus aestuarii]|uniref:Fluoride-specific ion channel FluC n=1 Tax=Pseudoroseicyclus aestuarii TaxID=1795041 RepID=A0A318SSM9_9RHOB|nr:CrcB family protein [Pseudoroseicyclus aestuarii]PYE84941.1 camphor resistance protein CrcB [Pseudoroseicyclus aestuarii]